MRALKIVAIVALLYVGVVAAFESLIGYFQPEAGSTLVLTTFDAGGPHDRVVSRLESDGRLYVAANHWPRAWYRRALANPAVQATLDGQKATLVGLVGRVPVGYKLVPVKRVKTITFDTSETGKPKVEF